MSWALLFVFYAHSSEGLVNTCKTNVQMLVISQIVYDWKWTETMGGREDQEKSRETEGEEETMS